MAQIMLWKDKMEDLLYVKGYHQPMFFKVKHVDKTDKEWTLLYRQVCGYIQQWVYDNVLNHVSGEKHARTLWIKFERLYSQKTENNQMYLMKWLILLRYHDDTPMINHLNIFQGLINQLVVRGVKFDEEAQGLWILGTLSDSWETFRMSLFNSTPNSEMIMEIAKSSVLNEEMKRKLQCSSSQSNVLVTKAQERSKSKDPKNKENNRRP